MKTNSYPKYYRHVPTNLIEILQQFREQHPQRHLVVQGVDWSYLTGGRGKETMVFLPGGLGLAEAWFQIFTAFQQDYSIVAVTYPSVSTMKELADGIISILDAEGIQHGHFIGASMGGMLAQVFVRLYPERVDRLVLANTAAPDRATADHLEQHNRRALHYPMWLIRWASVGSLQKHLASISSEEREFWKAYFQEAIYNHWDRESITSEGRCTVDYARNYQFQPGELAEMEDRILIIQSEDDLAIQPELGATLRMLYPGACLHTFSKAGHIPFITCRDPFIHLIREFLQRI